MRRTAIIAAVASLALLPACTEETEPSPMPTSEDALTTATEEPEDEAVTSEPEETTEEPTTEEPDAEGPPEMPAEAKELTEAGAEAFVAYYISRLDEAYISGSDTGMDQLATSGCSSCTALLEDIPENEAGEQTFDHESSEAEIIGNNLARVETVMEVTRGPGAGEGGLVFDLSFDERWRVDSIRLQGES